MSSRADSQIERESNVMCMWFSFFFFFSSIRCCINNFFFSVWFLAFVKYTIYFLMIVLCFVLFFLLSFCLTFTWILFVGWIWFDVFVMFCYRFNLAHCLILIWLSVRFKKKTFLPHFIIGCVFALAVVSIPKYIRSETVIGII